MSVKLNISPLLKHLTNGIKVIEVDGDTTGRCIDRLTEQFPAIKQTLFDDAGKLRSYIDVYLNGESAYPGELTRPVKDGDEITVTLTIAGG
ncbi:MoaD/ThiS family protein [Chloroflexota bacterium]